MLSNSKLGFGLMRLPKDESGSIDLPQVQTMVDHFMNSGFTYFDTAYAYAGSENAIRETLVKNYPRTSFTLADKLPAWKLKNKEDVKRIFNESLEAAGVDYFDFYLLHSVEEKHLPTYERLGAFEFLKEMKAQGKISHIGFSYHDGPELLEKILTDHPELEFVQLQLNYLDWENGVIQSRSNYEVAKKFDKPIIVMEPIKGGTLASLPPEAEKIRQQNIAQTSAPALALRFLAEKDGIMTILSGMSAPEQMTENAETMKFPAPLSEAEKKAVKEITGRSCRLIRSRVPNAGTVFRDAQCIFRSLIFSLHGTASSFMAKMPVTRRTMRNMRMPAIQPAPELRAGSARECVRSIFRSSICLKRYLNLLIAKRLRALFTL